MRAIGNKLAPLIVAGSALTAFAAPAQHSLSVNAQFSDPAFWDIVKAGPDDSDELERVVSTYVVAEMHEDAIAVFVDYLLGVVAAPERHCEYCIHLLTTAETRQEANALPLFLEATDRLVGWAHEQGTGDVLVVLASMTARSQNRANWNRGLYFMAHAALLGVSDDRKVQIVQFLAEIGRYEDARSFARSIYADPRSTYFESELVQQWLGYLDSEIARHARIGMLIARVAQP